MWGRVGSDHHGASLRDALAMEIFDATGVVFDPIEATGVALVMVDEQAQNRIVVIAGANGKVDLDEEALTQALAKARFLVMQLEVPLPQVVRAAKVAQRLGCKVVLNAAPAQALTDELWPLIDTMIVNETEAQALTGIALDDLPATAALAAQAIRDRGVPRVVVTLGKWGAVAIDANSRTYHPAPVVRAVDTTGAGDAFLGAVTVAMAQQLSLANSVEWGIRAAALCVQTMGAQPSSPSRSQVLQSPPAPAWIIL
jgi:ribokinase